MSQSDDGANYHLVGTPSSASFSDPDVVGNHAYLYRVRAKNSDGAATPWGAVDVMTTVAFTDDPLAPRSTVVKAQHLQELRDAVNAVRALARLAPATFLDPAVPGLTIQARHVLELRTALAEARAALVLPAVDFRSLRQAQSSWRTISWSSATRCVSARGYQIASTALRNSVMWTAITAIEPGLSVGVLKDGSHLPAAA